MCEETRRGLEIILVISYILVKRYHNINGLYSFRRGLCGLTAQCNVKDYCRNSSITFEEEKLKSTPILPYDRYYYTSLITRLLDTAKLLNSSLIFYRSNKLVPILV